MPWVPKKHLLTLPSDQIKISLKLSWYSLAPFYLVLLQSVGKLKLYLAFLSEEDIFLFKEVWGLMGATLMA